MKRILLTAEEAAVASENGVSTESIDAFLNTLEKMELKEIVSKYGESFIWAIITTITGIILVHWALKVIMRYVEKSNLAPGATKFLRGIVAFLLYFVVILTAASVLGIPVTSVLAIFSVFTLAFSLAIKDIIALFASAFFTALNNGLVSAILSFLRMFLFQIVCVFALPAIFGIEGIWFSVSVAELLCLFVSVAFIFKNKNKYGYM